MKNLLLITQLKVLENFSPLIPETFALTFEDENYLPPPGLRGLYTPEGEEKRQAINAWIRTSDAFDAVIDFEKALRDPAYPTQMLADYDCGDHLHPSDAGYLRMGDIIDLSLFDQD